MFTRKDQLGRDVFLTRYPPVRIVSLVPSQTELLYELGLDKEVTGITKFCVHPHTWHTTKERVGGTKNIDIDRIRSLHPDLVFANKEENVREQIEEVSTIAPVWVSDVSSLQDAARMILSVGQLIDRQEKAAALAASILQRFMQLHRCTTALRTCYLIWRNPYMTVGGDTFVSDMLNQCGFLNVFGDLQRYPQITADMLVATHPELVLLSSEPYPFKEKHLAEIAKILPATKIMLVDGEMFSWYGSRLLLAAGYLNDLIQSLDNN